MAKIRKLSVLKNLLKAFREGATITAACKAAGIARMTYFRWIVEWPDFGKRCEVYQNKSRIRLIKDTLYSEGMKGNIQAAKVWLEYNADKTIPADPPPAPPPPAVAPEVHVHLDNRTQFNMPVANEDERLRLIANAELIRKHRLIDRTLGTDGSEPVSGVCPEGQQRPEDNAGSNPPGDPVAHSGVQAPG